MFRRILSPHLKEKLEVSLANAITKYFGTLDKLKEEFSNAAAQFGSGWSCF